MNRPLCKCSGIFWLLLFFKVGYLASICGALFLWPVQKSEDMFPGARLQCTTDDHLTFTSHFGTWDAEHYLFLTEYGYQHGSAACAFYPLWPYAIRWFSYL